MTHPGTLTRRAVKIYGTLFGTRSLKKTVTLLAA
jgi:hypothetical protein